MGKCNLVGVFKIYANRDATSEARYFNGKLSLLDLALQEDGG
jgi:hypothetical protein